jgi:proteasome alpha subunit
LKLLSKKLIKPFRPFGPALFVAGYEAMGPRLFATDPSGALMEYKASSEGSGRNGAMSFFESNFKDDLSKEEAIVLGLKALHQATEEKLNPEAAEIGIVDRDFDFKILTPEETQGYAKQALGGN